MTILPFKSAFEAKEDAQKFVMSPLWKFLKQQMITRRASHINLAFQANPLTEDGRINILLNQASVNAIDNFIEDIEQILSSEKPDGE